MSGLKKDLSFPSTASTSQEGRENSPSLTSNRTLRVTLLSSEWRSTKGGLSTINRELAIQLAKHPNVAVSVYLPQCSEQDKRVADLSHKVQLIEAKKLIGFEPLDWLLSVPANHHIDCVIGHGLPLGRQIQLIQQQCCCKWIQVVHTAPEELGKYKSYADAISKGEKKHLAEIELCELADQVVAVGPNLADAYSRYLRYCQKDQAVLKLTPGIFSEFADVKQAPKEGKAFCVLVFGRGDYEDFELKGYDIAAKAIAELSDKSYHLIFVGAPQGKEDEVTQKLCQQGIAPAQLTVRCFKESREQLARLLCEVDLAIMPSRTEGFGLVALEALSAGLPVLVSGSSGLGEALKKVLHGSSCVVESDLPKDWAKAIRAVRQKDRELRLEETKVLRGEYAKKYNWQEQCDRLVERMLDISLVGSSERQASRKGKRSLSPSGTPAAAPKQPRLLTDGHEGAVNSAIVKILQAEYNRRSKLRPLLWESTFQLPIENVYTRLKIVSRRKADCKIEDGEVNMYDIFKTLDKGEDVMSLVEGSPGIGKTTFCLKLAHDWANKKVPTEFAFPKFEFLLLLKCRDIDGDIMEAISEQLLPKDIKEKTREKLFDFIKDIHNQERILIILDGLDELPQKSQHHVHELLHRRILPFCYILATSRQERGIEVRKKFVFDMLLEIKGFAESDAFEYIRKHFENVGPGQSSRGERLIGEIKENTFLHALRSNPLNLLLLCVIYEDYEGKLPTSRSKLYQVIVHCLLRRYCAKHNLEAHEDDKALEKQFEKDILALGELAWRCLLNDRHCFREAELTELERQNKGLVAREIGLLFKEESLKRLNPQHEYYFLHKTFQEYLAASYIAHKLRRNQLDLFECLSFDDLVKKYPQVFLFVSGILGEKASILFEQIGGQLKSSVDWDWHTCSEEAATFFIESFSESGHAEKMAVTLCSFIPFPLVFNFNPNISEFGFSNVLKACKGFSSLQKPVELCSSFSLEVFDEDLFDSIVDVVESCPQLTTVGISTYEITSTVAESVCKVLSASMSLSEFTLKLHNITYDAAAILGHGLATCKALTKVTFQLYRVRNEAWANALEIGLSADTPLSSVVLEVYDFMNDTAVQALGRVVSNKSLKFLSLIICGDLQDSLAAVISDGLTGQTVLKSLGVHITGKLSSFGANFLEKGLLENRSLIDLRVFVHGELPGNWQTVVENLHLAKKAHATCVFHPNPCSRVTGNQMAHFHPVVVEKGLVLKQHLTANLWGELSCEGAKVLCEVVLVPSYLSGLTLNVHGKLTDAVANCISRCLKPHNIWGELTREGGSVLQRLSVNNLTVALNVHDLRVVPDESCNVLDVSIDNPASLTQLLTKVKDTRKEKLSLTINDNSDAIEDWTHCLGNALSENKFLTFNLRVNNSDLFAKDWALHLSEGLTKNKSLTTFTLTVNDSYLFAKDWALHLSEGLAKNKFLTTLTLTVNVNDSVCLAEDWALHLTEGLAKNKSLTTFNLTMNDNLLSEDWALHLSEGLAKNKSLTTFNLTMNDNSLSEDWALLLSEGLAKNKSLTTFNLTMNDNLLTMNDNLLSEDWALHLSEGLAKNKSLTTFNLTMNDNLLSGDWALLPKHKLTTFYLRMSEDWALHLNEGLAKNKSLTTFNLTMNPNHSFSDDWALHLSEGLAKNTSLTTLSLTLNPNHLLREHWAIHLSEGLAKNKSLTTFNLTMNDNSLSEDWALHLSKGMAKNKSLTTLSLTVNYHSKIEGHVAMYWLHKVSVGLEENTSLTTFNLTVNIDSEVSDDWLPKIVLRSDSLTTLRLQVNNRCATSGSHIYDFSKFEVDCRSLSLLEQTVGIYGMENES